jgi:hypothetical protein
MARPRFNGATATLAAVVGGAIGLALAMFLRALVLNTPAQVKPSTFFWWFVLLTAAGALWGLATQSMKQLERIQGYRHGGGLRAPGRSGDHHSAAQRREHEQCPDQEQPGPRAAPDQAPGERT